MDILTADIGPLIFKSTVKGDIGEFSLDSEMLKILMELDGKKDIVAISRNLKLSIRTLREAIIKLFNHNLIEQDKNAVKTIDDSFLEFLMDQLSVATGPIAEVLLEDEIHSLGVKVKDIPLQRSAELVELLARQIPRVEKRVAFQEAMVKKIHAVLS